MPLNTWTLRESIINYLREANNYSPTVLQAATKSYPVDNIEEIPQSPIICCGDMSSGLGLINGLLLHCNEQVIFFTTEPDGTITEIQ